jgi:hypothetical protein
MKKVNPGKKMRRPGYAALDALIEEITLDAYGDGEQLWAFRQAIEDNVALPCGGFVMGEPVSVIAFDFDGNERRGLTAKCRSANGRQQSVSAADVAMPLDSDGARYVAAYRKWMGLAPYSAAPPPPRSTTKPPAAKAAIESGAVELVVLSLKQKAARCRLLGSDSEVTLRATALWEVVPGEIAVVKPRKQWKYASHAYLSGKIESTRLDVGTLNLVPLKLEERGIWNPAEHYWGEDGEPIEEWAKPIIAQGRRPQFEMEQVLPGSDPEDPFSDPITESNDRKDGGDIAGAERILMDLCQSDLRCLDAHAHLGNLVFDRWPKEAIRHYEVGFQIGELSLGKGFDGLLPWGCIDNRPFLRCMNGFGLCLWRLDRFEEAGRIFDRMLWLNPTDNQGVRFLIDDVGAHVAWADSRNR